MIYGSTLPWARVESRLSAWERRAEAPAPIHTAGFGDSRTSLNPTSLGLGLATVNVEWQIENRLSISNLIFEQVLPDGTTRSVELPRLNRWVGSSGQGLVAPILPSPEAQNVVIRLRVIDMRDGEVFQEAEISVPIAAEASPAETEPITNPPLPTEEPTPGG